MSEAVADVPRSSGYKNLEPSALASLINNWFERVAAIIPPEKYKKLGAGDTTPLHDVPGFGRISLRYEGSRYLPKADDEPQRPLQRCEYTLFMDEGRIEHSPEEPNLLGWWMSVHMEYGPKLVLDDAATTEDLVGSTKEERQQLEKVLEELQLSYLATLAGVADVKP